MKLRFMQDVPDPKSAESPSAIVFAYHLNGHGGAEIMEPSQVSQGELPREPYWVHLALDDAGTRHWLEHHAKLEENVIDALMVDQPRPRVAETDEGSVIVFRGINFNADEEPEDMVSIRMFIDKHRIISVRKRKLMAVHAMRDALARGVGPNTTGEFVSMLADFLTTHMEPALAELHDMIDDAEEAVLDSPDQRLRLNIIDIRKQAILFHRYIAPQRDALGRLKLSERKWLSESDKKLLLECFDRMTRYVEDIQAVRERSQIVHDELSFALSDRLNKNTFLLSIVSAVFLPLTFFTGLIGMNVRGIPGAESPQAFWYITSGLFVVVGFQLLWLKLKKWI
jgi:zinc transporter